MSALTDARKALETLLKDVLGEGTQVFAIIPERVVPPFVSIGPSDPYIDYEGAVFGGRIVHLTASCVVAPGTNDKQADALDDLIVQVVGIVDDSGDFVVERVEQPGQLAVNGQAHLGANVMVRTEI